MKYKVNNGKALGQNRAITSGVRAVRRAMKGGSSLRAALKGLEVHVIREDMEDYEIASCGELAAMFKDDVKQRVEWLSHRR